MQIVIKIPEENYERMLAMGEMGALNNPYLMAIANGTPLQKGHGDLKDVSQIGWQPGCFIDSEGQPIPIIHKIATIEMIRDWLPTIIEADKEE